jgi:hypothetical protein
LHLGLQGMTAFGGPVKQGSIVASKRVIGMSTCYPLEASNEQRTIKRASRGIQTGFENASKELEASKSRIIRTPEAPDCHRLQQTHQITSHGGAYLARARSRVGMLWAGGIEKASEPLKLPSAPNPQSRSPLTIPTKSRTRAELTTPGLCQGLKCLREFTGGDRGHPSACW